MFWDEEIYCFDDGRSTTGFWSNPVDSPYRAYFGGVTIGDYTTEDEARKAVEDRYQTLTEEAEAQGYKRETCGKCGTVFEPYHHFIRCDDSECPMSTGKTLFDYMRESLCDSE